MTNTLSPQDRARVATIVEKREFVELVLGPNGGGLSYPCLKSDPHNVLWKPEKNPRQWQLLIEWISDRIPDIETVIGRRNYLKRRFVRFIRNRDIAALESLALELASNE